jgi:hypothetical protein
VDTRFVCVDDDTTSVIAVNDAYTCTDHVDVFNDVVIPGFTVDEVAGALECGFGGLVRDNTDCEFSAARCSRLTLLPLHSRNAIWNSRSKPLLSRNVIWDSQT